MGKSEWKLALMWEFGTIRAKYQELLDLRPPRAVIPLPQNRRRRRVEVKRLLVWGSAQYEQGFADGLRAALDEMEGAL